MNNTPDQPTPESLPHGVPKPPNKKALRVVQVLTIVIVIAALAATVYFREHIADLKQYGYAAVFLVGLVSNATVILPVPGLALSSIMGGVFNPFVVGVVGGVGQALGEMTGYMAGYSGQTLIDENSTYNRLTRWMQRHGIWPIFILAAIPNPVFDISGMAAGALRFPWWKFLLACTAGKVVKNIAFALAGFYGIDALSKLFTG